MDFDRAAWRSPRYDRLDTLMTDALKLHSDSIVIDAVCPLAEHDPRYLKWYREGGVTTLAPTVGSTESARATLDAIGVWHRLLREREDLLLVTRAADVETAKRSGRLGIYLHIQGSDPIERNLDLIARFSFASIGWSRMPVSSQKGCERCVDRMPSRSRSSRCSRSSITPFRFGQPSGAGFPSRSVPDRPRRPNRDILNL